MESTLRIGDFAQVAGVTPRTIRHYESLGLIPRPERGPGGYRLYEPAALLAIAEIRRLRSLGMSLADIADTRRQNGDGGTLRERLRQLKDEIDREVAQLSARRDALDELEDAVAKGEAILGAGRSTLFDATRSFLSEAGASDRAIDEARRLFSALASVGLPSGWDRAMEGGMALVRDDDGTRRGWIEALELIAELRDVDTTDARVADAAGRLAELASAGGDVRASISFADESSVAIAAVIASCFSAAQVAAALGAAARIGVLP